MSQSARTPAIPRSAIEPVDDLDAGLGVSPSEILERLWLVLISMRTALVLMLALAVLGLVGTLVVQAPTGLQGDPQVYPAWLDSIRPKYGGWTDWMDRLQLFSIFSSVWMKAIVVVLVTSILACSVNRFRGLWKAATRPRVRMSGAFYERASHSAYADSAAETDAALADVQGVLRARRFRTVVERDGDAVHVYADKFRWAPFGTVIAHVSLILILVGVLVGGALGFRNSEFAVPVGSTADVGNGSGLTVEAKSFSDSYYDNGAPSDYASDLVLYRDGTQVAAQTIRVNDPLRYDGYAFYQSFFGPAAAMQVKDDSGAVLYERGVPLLWTSDDGKHRVGQFSLPDRGLTVYVVGAASGEVDPQIKAGQMQLELYQDGAGDTPISTQLVSQGEPATIAGLEFTFVRERQYTGLIVAKDPGQFLVWGGAGLLVLGLFLVFFFPNRRFWARIVPGTSGSTVHVGATSRHDASFGPEFEGIVTDMKLALSGQSAS